MLAFRACLSAVTAPLVLALAWQAAAAELPAVVRKNPGNSMPVEIVRQGATNQGRTFSAEIRAPQGIFSVLVDFQAAKQQDVRKLVFRVKQVRAWEGVSFYPARKPPGALVDLREAKDVNITAEAGDCVIDISGDTAKQIVESGGMFQFVDFYRG